MSELLSSKPTCCIVYTTDSTYLFPTFVSAMQARLHSSKHKADVTIYCIGVVQAVFDLVQPMCASEGITLIALDPKIIEGASSMMARLFLNRFAPAHYTDYLYLDGDIHILDSLDPLIDIDVPDGCFLAANDPMTFLLADDTPLSNDLRRHLHSIGFTKAEQLKYFNSGALRIKAKGWETTGLEAWNHFVRLGHGSRFPDQDALNLAGKHRRLPMSLAWNYPVFLRNSRIETKIKPRIKHFMSSPKPWHGSFPPWTQADCDPYQAAIDKFPALEALRPKPLSIRDRVMYHLQQNGKRIVESLSWGRSKRRTRILHYQDACQPSLAAVSPPSVAQSVVTHLPSKMTASCRTQ